MGVGEGKKNNPTIVDDEEKPTGGQKCLKFVKHNLLLFMLVGAMILGITMGVSIRVAHPEFGQNRRNLMYFEFPGTILMNMLKLCIIPLIVSSLISGMGSLPVQSAGKLGGRAVLFYFSTTFLAIFQGIILVLLIRPGELDNVDGEGSGQGLQVNPADAMLDLVRNALTDNIVEATFRQTRTRYTFNDTWENITRGNETSLVRRQEIVDFTIGKEDGLNILGIVVFCVAFGVIMGRMQERGKPLKDFFKAMEEAIITIVKLVIWYAPIGIAFLLAGRIMAMDDPARRFSQLALYMVTVIVGLIVHGFIVLPLIYFAIVRKNPFRFIGDMAEALITAIGTASSSATLPLTLRCLTEKAGIDHRIGEFVLPVGATINMDGTALYEAVAAIFIAQYNGIELSFGQIITISITATAAAIGAAGVPEAGLVTMAIVLTAVGLPTDDLPLIFAVDWFLDRFRTGINVWGDSIGAGIVEKLSLKDLQKMDKTEEAKKTDAEVVELEDFPAVKASNGTASNVKASKHVYDNTAYVPYVSDNHDMKTQL